MSAPRTPADQAAREAVEQQRDQSAFVSAGAGTGKTSTLVARVVATVTDDAVPIRQVAAITFTERAAGELRERVRSALADRVAAHPDDGVARDALRDVDAATIGTIHGFAVTVLREHALAAGLPVGFEVADDLASGGARRDRRRRVVEHWEATLDDSTRQVLEAAGLAPVSLAPLVDDLDAARPRLHGPLVDPAELLDLDRLRLDAVDALNTLFADYLEPCGDLGDKLAERMSNELTALRDSLVGGVPDLVTMVALRGDWLEPFKNVRGGKPKVWDPLGGPQSVRDAIRAVQAVVAAWLDAPVENALRTCLASAWTVLADAQAERATEGLLEFDDLLLVARDLLHDDPEVRAAVHERFRLLLVDEFQDTDPVQWEIAQLVTADPATPGSAPLPGRLVVVGDPKQSIYGFRGADIRTYLAASAVMDDVQHELSVSFRSVKPLVTWINDVFGALVVGSEVQPEYEPLVAHHDPAHDAPGPSVLVLRDPPLPEPSAPGDDADPDDTAPGDSDPAGAAPDEAAAVAGEPARTPSRDLEPLLVAAAIRRAVDEGWQVTDRDNENRTRYYKRPATYRDVAILVPTRAGVDDLLDALDTAGVPHRTSDAGLVLARPMVSGLVAALRALDDPDDQLGMWWALKSPLFGCSDDDLLAYRRRNGPRWRLPRPDDELEPGVVTDSLRVLAGVRDAMVAPQPADVLTMLVHRCRALETLALVPRGTFDADCVSMLLGHARAWQDAGGVGLRDYVALLTAMQQERSRASLDEPDDLADDAVRISTIHGAKGLEFPVVVLAGMATGQRADDIRLGVRPDGGFEVRFGPVQSFGFADWKASDREPREAAELVRLLYVACTRARDHLVVSVVGEERKGSLPPRSDVLRQVVLGLDAPQLDTPDLLAPAAATVLAPIVAAGTGERAAIPDDWPERVAAAGACSAVPWVRSPSHHDRHRVAPAAADALADGIPDDAAPPSPESEVAAAVGDAGAAAVARAARDGRPLGRAMHAALDTLFSAAEPPGEEAVHAAVAGGVAAEGVPAAADDVLARVTAALGTELAAEVFAAPRRWTELYLAAPVNEGGVRLVEGYADLVLEVADGFVVIDHKSDATISPETRAGYDAQLAAYADLLTRATGRPVVRRVLLHLPGPEAHVIELDA